MINLLIALTLMCGSFGVTLSKITTNFGVRKPRQHTEPLTLFKDITKQ